MQQELPQSFLKWQNKRSYRCEVSEINDFYPPSRQMRWKTIQKIKFWGKNLASLKNFIERSKVALYQAFLTIYELVVTEKQPTDLKSLRSIEKVMR